MIAYSDPKANIARTAGLVDDYAFTAIAALDAYEVTGRLRYFEVARQIADKMVENFYDETRGGFFDCAEDGEEGLLGALSAPRKPFQDSPTPSGNSAAAIAAAAHVCDDERASYRDKAEKTLAGICRIGRAGRHLSPEHMASRRCGTCSRPHTQVVVIGDDRARPINCTRRLSLRSR